MVSTCVVVVWQSKLVWWSTLAWWSTPEWWSTLNLCTSTSACHLRVHHAVRWSTPEWWSTLNLCTSTSACHLRVHHAVRWLHTLTVDRCPPWIRRQTGMWLVCHRPVCGLFVTDLYVACLSQTCMWLVCHQLTCHRPHRRHGSYLHRKIGGYQACIPAWCSWVTDCAETAQKTWEIREVGYFCPPLYTAPSHRRPQCCCFLFIRHCTCFLFAWY